MALIDRKNIGQKDENVLILTSNFGDGHLQVANAISSFAKTNYPEMVPLTVDFMEVMLPTLYPLTQKLFVHSVKKFPSLYKYFYNKTEYGKPTNILKFINRFGMHHLMDVLFKIRPSVIITTFPLAAAVISMLKDANLITIPHVTIITDYAYHSLWVDQNTDYFIVGSEDVKQGLKTTYGIEDEKIAVTGIPVKPEFTMDVSKPSVREGIQFSDKKPTILIMGGGLGVFDRKEHLFSVFEKLQTKIQLIIVCGRNEKMRQKVVKEFKHSKHDVLIKGYVQNIHEFMSIADLLITKPGGVTISEAIVKKLPMIIFHPLPGQEESNTRFLLNANVALLANTPHELQTYISSLLRDQQQLLQLKKEMEKLYLGVSALHALDIIKQFQEHTLTKKAL